MFCKKINWRNDSRTERVTIEKWNELIDFYRKNTDYEEVDYNDERRFKIVFWFGKFQINIKDPKYPTLYVGTTEGELIRYIVNSMDEEKNEESRMTGNEAYRMVSDLFKSLTGKTIGNAFGHVPQNYKRFVKPAIVEIDKRYAGQNVYGVYKADFSSAYPAAACGIMPDATSAITISGYVKPSKEYPFAFYKSGHLAEYESFETKKWIDTFYGKYIKLAKGKKRKDEFDSKTIALNEEDEETILMKASNFELTETMKILYNKRKEDPQIKTAMIAFFGYCQSLKFNKARYAHIVAVVYARHIQKMIDATKKLKKAGCVPLMYATDSIAWRGTPPEGLCDNEKKLGSFFIEHKNAVLRYKACGVYALQDLKTREIFVVKHQGVKLSDNKINKLRDIDNLSLEYSQVQDDGTIKRIKEDENYGAQK